MATAPPAISQGGTAAYWCYVSLGAGTLFPWNALITAADYWEARYPGKHTDRLLTVSYLPVNLVVIAAMVHWHGHIRPRLRIVGGLGGFTLAVSGVALLGLAPPTDASLAAVLLLVGACGACDGFAQGALFGEAAALAPRFTQALVAGTAVSGVAVSLLRIITKATLPNTPSGLLASANLYFSLAVLVCGACTIVYTTVLPRLGAVQRCRQAGLAAALTEASWQFHVTLAGDSHAARLPHQEPEGRLASSMPPLRDSSSDVELSADDGHHLGHSSAALQPLPQQQLHQPQHTGTPPKLYARPAEQEQEQGLLPLEHPMSVPAVYSMQQKPDSSPGGSPHLIAAEAGTAGGWALSLTVFRTIWHLALANAIIYIVTLSIFPGFLAEDVHSAELGSWYPVALIAAFNVADWAGKSLPGMQALRIRSGRGILALTVFRALFVPVFHVAAMRGAGSACIGMLTLALGLSNGYCTAVAMMQAPEAVPTAHAALAGNQMVLFLILGLCIGAACGFLWLL